MIAFRTAAGYSPAYSSPLLAAIMRPVHEYDAPQAPEARRVAGRVASSDGLRYRLSPTMDNGPAMLPTPSPEARVTFAILCARSVCQRPGFLEWADGWLSGRDRTKATAFAALAPVPVCDRAYVAHWATMAGAFPHDATFPAQTAALLAAYVCPEGTFDFETRALAALEMCQ